MYRRFDDYLNEKIGRFDDSFNRNLNAKLESFEDYLNNKIERYENYMNENVTAVAHSIELIDRYCKKTKVDIWSNLHFFENVEIDKLSKANPSIKDKRKIIERIMEFGYNFDTISAKLNQKFGKL